jgi:hypothetical protein
MTAYEKVECSLPVEMRVRHVSPSVACHAACTVLLLIERSTLSRNLDLLVKKGLIEARVTQDPAEFAEEPPKAATAAVRAHEARR